MGVEIIYSHIPKTGGVSFRNTLLTHYKPEEILPPWNWFNLRPEMQPAIDMWQDYDNLKREWNKRANNINPNVKVIMGHFPMRLFDGLFPDALRMIWLRNPINRVVSVYHHYKRKGGLVGDHTKDARPMSQDMSLKDFVDAPQQQDVMSHFYTTYEEFDFIGFVEHYENSLDLFYYLMGWKEKSKPVHLNKGSYEPVSIEMRQYISWQNARDHRLYRSFIDDKDQIT